MVCKGEKMAFIELKNINKKYEKKSVLENLNLDIYEGEFVGIKGKSGRGKTTLLNIIGLQETFEGDYYFNGNKVDLKDKKMVRNLLKNQIGYLFQNFALIDDLTVYDNLCIVMDKKDKTTEKEMKDALELVGLNQDFLHQKVYKCSGGEQQRIAVARLILKNCKLILADEPTGSLDMENANLIMKLLTELNEKGKTIVMVSHDDKLISQCKRVVEL